MLGEPGRGDLRRAGGAAGHWGPRRLHSLGAGVAGLHAAAHVRGHGLVHLRRAVQAQGGHDRHHLILCAPAAQARVVGALLPHSRHRAALVVVAGVEQALFRQREDLVVNGAIQSPGVAALEVCATTTAHKEGVAGEGPGAVVGDIREAARGVARRGAHLQGLPTEGDHVAVADEHIGVGPGVAAHHRLGAGLGAQEARAGDVVGVNVGVQGVA